MKIKHKMDIEVGKVLTAAGFSVLVLVSFCCFRFTLASFGLTTSGASDSASEDSITAALFLEGGLGMFSIAGPTESLQGLSGEGETVLGVDKG